MKKNEYLIISFLALMLGLDACQDNVIDLAPLSTLTEANFYQSAAELDKAVLGIYNRYQSRMPRDWALFEMPSDHLHMSNYRHIGGLEAVNNLDFQPENDLFRNFWQASYNGIFRANAVLTHLHVPQNYVASQKEQLEGEAKFMRALFYFDLVRAFGAVPKVTSVLSVDASKTLQRASEEEIYGLIVDDLKDAINTLPLKEDMATGRASRSAAVALLGKVYIYMEDWGNALTYLNMVSDYNHALVDDFASLWKLESENNEEVIFAIKYLQNTNGHTLSSEFIPFYGVEGISTAGYETAFLSWGLHKKYEVSDTRKDATITEYWKAPGSDDPLAWRPYVNKYAVPHSGYSSGIDLPVLRYADIVLLKAEALYRLNQPAEALIELNKIRTRAFGDTSHNYELVDISTLDAFLDKLLLERQLELAFENQRWFDLVRTGRFIEELDEVELSYNTTTQTAQVVTLNPQPHHRYFPIPQHEIDQAAPNVLVQNDGY